MIRYTRDNGIAPIISAILLVAITVGMVAVVGVVVVSMTNMSNMPAAGILIEEKQGVVTITHFAGEELKVGNYYILVDDADRTKDFTGPGLSDGYFGPGDILSWSVNIGALRHVSVVYDGEKGTYLLAEKWFDGISGDGGLSAAFTMTSSTGTGRSDMPSILQDAAADLTGGCPMTVSFSPIESSGDAEYLWTFGNGNTSSESSSSQEYTSVGEYIVTLKVTNKMNGGWNSSSQTISVRKSGLTAMTWVKFIGNTNNDKVPSQSFYFRASTLSQATAPEWGLQVGGRNAFEFKLRTFTSTPDYLLTNFSPKKDVWYHLTGISDGIWGNFYVNASGDLIILPGGGKGNARTVNGAVQFSGTTFQNPGTQYAMEDSYELSFPLTLGEISKIYNSQKENYS